LKKMVALLLLPLSFDPKRPSGSSAPYNTKDLVAIHGTISTTRHTPKPRYRAEKLTNN
jgi:hypothetical protein